MRRIILMVAALGLLAIAPLALGDSPKKAPHRHIAGAVTAVGSDSITVQVLWTGKNATDLLGQSETIAVTSDTTITAGKAHTPVALSSIHLGDLVGLGVTAASADSTAFTAVRIHVNCNCHWLGGTIGSIGSSSLTVHVLKTGPFDTVLKGSDVTLQLNGATSYISGKAKTVIGLGDLKAGDRVGVMFGASGFFKAPTFDVSTATFTAKRVHDWGVKKAVPAASTDAGSAATTDS